MRRSRRIRRSRPTRTAARAIALRCRDTEGAALTDTIVAPPTHGTLSGRRGVTYTPAADYSGADSFTFRVPDSKADSNLAKVNITVKPVNDPPEGEGLYASEVRFGSGNRVPCGARTVDGPTR